MCLRPGERLKRFPLENSSLKYDCKEYFNFFMIRTLSHDLQNHLSVLAEAAEVSPEMYLYQILVELLQNQADYLKACEPAQSEDNPPSPFEKLIRKYIEKHEIQVGQAVKRRESLSF